MLTFWGNCDVPSGLDHLDFCKETIGEIILAKKTDCSMFWQKMKQYINYLTLICQNFLLSQLLCCGQVLKFLFLVIGDPVT